MCAYRDLASGSYLLAERQARAVLAQQPDDPDVMRVVGFAISAMGEAARAAPVLNQAADLQPDAPHPCMQLLRVMPDLPQSLVNRQLQACLRLCPTNVRLRLALAEQLLDTGEPDEAEAVLLHPNLTADSHYLLGLARADQGRFPSAIISFGNAVELDPTQAANWSNLGMMLKIEDRFDEAIKAHNHAVALAPDNPRFRVNRSVTLLRAGRWGSAWQDYEWRLRLSNERPELLDRLLPSLADLGDLTGLTILAQHEEGFGDTLQFLRYLPLLADYGARVVAFVPQALARVVAAVDGVDQVITDPRQVPAFDFACPFFSLPRAFGTTVATIPPPPRVRPDPAEVLKWRSRLPSTGLLAGLVWAGQSRPWLADFGTLDRRRSAGLAAFAPLAEVEGVEFVSLQVGRAAREAPPPGISVIDLSDHIGDFADTAALIAALDVVISVDTSVVHLAGLLGKPVFLLDRYDSCWRWLSGRIDSPWYPRLTIFRQDQPNDWSAPMVRIAASLEAMALYHGAIAKRVLGDAFREPAFRD